MNVRIRKITYYLVVIALAQSCLGDKKMADIEEMGNTSFVNKNFKGNRINYNMNSSACENMSASVIASMYSVTEDKVIFNDISKSDRRVPNSPPICNFYIKDGENDFLWLRGSISMIPDNGKNADGTVTNTSTGYGKDWAEEWAIQKSTSKSSEWIETSGMAALWNESKRVLNIKFEGYTLNINPPGNKLNKDEATKNRDYKKAALAMAKACGYIN